MKKKNIKPEIKNSFFILYKDDIRFVIEVMGICGISFWIYSVYLKLNMSVAQAAARTLMTIVIGIIILYAIRFVYFYVEYLMNQRRIPLSDNEIQALNLNNIEEYIEYLGELLNHFYPKGEVFFLLLIATYNYFEKDNCKHEKLDLNQIFDCDNPNLDLNELSDFSVTNKITIKSKKKYKFLVKIVFDKESLQDSWLSYYYVSNIYTSKRKMKYGKNKL